MPYIGNPIYQSAFVTDTFSGNGSTTAFTMSVAPAGVSNVLIAISGVLQDPATYGVVGNTLNFSQAPPTGTNNISCRYLGVPATGVTTTAYRTQTEFTATAGQTTFSVPSYTPGFIDVYRNGVLLASTNFVATNGTTVVLNNAASEGDLVETISFLVSSVLNAIPATAGSVGTSNIANGVTINFADGSASTPSITNDGDTNTGIFFPAADTIAFSEGGVESMRIDSVGNVGIGLTTVTAKLDVAGAVSATPITNGVVRIVTTGSNPATGSGGGLLFAQQNSGGTFSNYASITGSRVNNAANDKVDLAFSTGSPADSIAIAERMRITSDGNVGIGTTSIGSFAGYTTEAIGGGSSAGGIIQFQGASSSDGAHLRLSRSGSTITDLTLETRSGTAAPVIFGANGTERMRIASSGSVGIGTNNPDKNLTVQSSAAETIFEITSTSTNGKAYDWISGGSGGNFAGGRFGLFSRTDAIELMAATSNTGSTAGGTTGRGVGFAHAGIWIDRGWADFPSITVCNTNQTGNTNQSQIRMHGTNATWGSYPNGSGSDFSCSFFIDGTYQTGSDRRFKTNISTIENALNKVMLMEGKRFQTLTSAGDIEPGFTENGFRYGFIAQELQSAGLDELYKHNVDEDDGTEGYNKAYAVDYDSVAPLLVNAIKEQQAMITELKATVDAQAARIAALEGATE